MLRLFPILLTCLTMHAADWYTDVGATGPSSNSGTIGNPWTNLASIVWASINSADVLWINQGTYGEPLNFQKPGVIIKPYPSVTQPAVFTWGQAYASTGARVDGYVGGNQRFKFTAKSPLTHYVLIRGAGTNVYWSGCEVAGSTNGDVGQAHGIYTGDGISGLVLANNYVHDVSGDAYSINNMLAHSTAGFTNSAVLTNCMAIRTHDDGVEFSGGGEATVTHCYFDTQGVAAMFGAHPDGVQTSLGYGNYKIETSYFSGFNQYIFWEFAGPNMWAINNRFFSGKTTGTDRAFNTSGGAVCTNWVVANNTGFNFLTFGFINGGLPADAIYANNILLNCRWASIDGSVTNISNGFPNLWWDNPGIQFYDDNGNPVSPPSNRNQGAGMSHGNPLLNAWIPQAGSAAIGTGTNLSAYFTTDALGQSRVAPWSMGAFLPSGLPPIIVNGTKLKGAVRLRVASQ